MLQGLQELQELQGLHELQDLRESQELQGPHVQSCTLICSTLMSCGFSDFLRFLPQHERYLVLRTERHKNPPGSDVDLPIIWT